MATTLYRYFRYTVWVLYIMHIVYKSNDNVDICAYVIIVYDLYARQDLSMWYPVFRTLYKACHDTSSLKADGKQEATSGYTPVGHKRGSEATLVRGLWKLNGGRSDRNRTAFFIWFRSDWVKYPLKSMFIEAHLAKLCLLTLQHLKETQGQDRLPLNDGP